MLQRKLCSTLGRNRDLGNILILKKLTQKTQKLLLYAYLPVGVLTTSSPSLPVPKVFGGQKSPQALVLPITGGETEAKDQAQVVGETAPVLQRPFSGGLITTHFSSWHPGIDLAIAQGTPVKPIMAGKVTQAQWDFGYGQCILVDHGNGMISRYAHLSKMNARVGDEVNSETVIGLVGSTGYSTGPHLHIEISVNDSRVDPLGLLPEDQEPQTVAHVPKL